jgi:queuine tRNA-ribosyltransferase
MFELLKTDAHTKARLGRLTTAHGVVDTPVYMPVGTQASVKALDPRELVEMGTQIILGNTYHLNIRPGLDIIRAAGGLHRFMNWELPILTDSGGFQVFSLAKIRKIKPHGVEFRSHLDGSPLFLGPKEAMEIQRVLGSDIAMAFDECPPHDAPAREQKLAVERTIRWARECREQPRAPGQLVFGIVQGGANPALREECAKALVAMDFDGYAIGGVSVGEPEPEMLKAIELTEPFLPANCARYAMGLGTPAQMVELIARGMDMFDCVLPTRSGRHCLAFTWGGRLNLRNARYAEDPSPLDAESACPAARYERAYLHHLVRSGEMLGPMLLSYANVQFYEELMARARDTIAEGCFATFAAEMKRRYSVPHDESEE